MFNLSMIEIDAFLMKNLNLQSPPVGISILKSALHENIERPDRNYTFCEVVERSRKQGEILRITKDDIDCPFALEVLGLQKISWGKLGEIITSKQFGPQTLKFISTFSIIGGGGCKSIVIGPLKDLRTTPDVVLIYGDADNLVKLVNAWTWMRGKPINVSMHGIGGICSESVAAAYNKTEPTICALPCKGSKQLGKLEAGEIIFASRYNFLDELIKGLKEIELPPEDAESFIIKLLRTKGRMTTRAITRELLMFIPRCPDYPAKLLAKMRSKGKINFEYSDDKGYVWCI